MKKLVFAIALLFGASSFAQTVEQLKAEKAKKDTQISVLQAESNALKAKIDAFPGWKFGVFGTIGANFSGFNNWYSNAVANSSAGSIGITVNGYANLDREKYFWRNSGNINLGWVKLDDLDNPKDDKSFKASTDVFNISSLYGYKLNKYWAVSALGEYRTTFIKNFNDPGYLDLGVGATWTPIKELVVVIHPLNYNFVFSKGGSSYDSSLGAKIVAEYNKKFYERFSFSSKFSAFLSYKDSDLSNWTWINSLGFNIWKGIGVGLEGGLRQNKQEVYNLGNTKGWTKLEQADNQLQSYWLVGLSYAF
ncbi:MAG: DUF3078 domain-containing protein [Tenacibaculum sp.]|nr:DUF3078 domain-containing protein [Tenacibaculum sp.]